MIGAMSYSFAYLCIGLPLKPLEPDVCSFCQEAIHFGKANALIVVFQMFRQTILNLQLGGDRPTLAVDQDKILAALEGQAYAMTLRDISTFRPLLAVVFGDFEKAAKAAIEALDSVGQKSDIHPLRRELRLTHTGIAAFGLYRQTEERSDIKLWARE